MTVSLRKSKAFLLVGCLAALSGCSLFLEVVEPPPKTAIVMNGELAAAQLHNAINRNLATPTESGLVADAKAPVANLQAADGQVSIAYSGEAAVLMDKVARAKGMKFQVTGPQPRLPLFVTVAIKGGTWNQLYRDVGAQFGQRADLVLHDDGIEIRYRGNF